MTTYSDKAISSVSAVLASAVQLSNIGLTCNLHHFIDLLCIHGISQPRYV